MKAPSVEIEWNDYPRIAPGEYQAYCKCTKRYHDPGFHRWTCMLRWDVLTDDLMSVIACVPLWLPLGTGDMPHASRRGKYFREWNRANGGPPVRGDRLSPRVFIQRMARVEIGDTVSPAPYSVVRRIIEWETGLPSTSVTKSHSQGKQPLTGSDEMELAPTACQKIKPVSSGTVGEQWLCPWCGKCMTQHEHHAHICEQMPPRLHTALMTRKTKNGVSP